VGHKKKPTIKTKMPPKRVFKPIKPTNKQQQQQQQQPPPPPLAAASSSKQTNNSNHQNQTQTQQPDQPPAPILLEELESLLNTTAPATEDTKPDISLVIDQNIPQENLQASPLFKPSSPEPLQSPQTTHPALKNPKRPATTKKKTLHEPKNHPQHNTTVDNELWLSKNLTDPVKTVEV
jgi:hypothetical protein